MINRSKTVAISQFYWNLQRWLHKIVKLELLTKKGSKIRWFIPAQIPWNKTFESALATSMVLVDLQKAFDAIRGHSFSTYTRTDISYPLIRTNTCAYQRRRNLSFLENFAYVLNEWSLNHYKMLHTLYALGSSDKWIAYFQVITIRSNTSGKYY